MFEVDEEVANQSHTVKNMIEGARARQPLSVRPQHVSACLTLLLGSRRFRLCPQPCCLCRPLRMSLLLLLLLPPPLQKTDTGTEEMIPLPNVPGKILSKVIEYCKFHVEAGKQVGVRCGRVRQGGSPCWLAGVTALLGGLEGLRKGCRAVGVARFGLQDVDARVPCHQTAHANTLPACLPACRSPACLPACLCAPAPCLSCRLTTSPARLRTRSSSGTPSLSRSTRQLCLTSSWCVTQASRGEGAAAPLCALLDVLCCLVAC